MILVFNILMNDIVGKTSQRKASAGKKNFNLIGGRQFRDAIEDVAGLVPG
jgi:hypothetical protein